jgi:two-component system, OmpR family, response regulator
MAVRVLVVDDEQDFLESIVMRLELRSIEVAGVGTGVAALELLDAKPFDVVVLDIKMPGMDGIEVLRQIRRKHPGVEVIVLTGHASQEFRQLGRELGAFDYLIKPVRLDTVLERIQAACRRRRGTDCT